MVLARRALLAGLCLAAPLAAQGPDTRVELDRYRAGLETIRDTTTLRRMVQAQEPERADSTIAAVGWLRRGFTRLRLGHAGDGWSFGRAAGDFTTAADLRPRWPLPWYGVALAQRGRAEWLAADRTNLGSRVGYGPLAEALSAARQALAVEPGYLPALALMVDAASRLRDTQAVTAEVLPALAGAWYAGVRDSQLVLALARVARISPFGAQGDSAPPLDELLRLAPATALAGHELAWSGLVAGRPWADSLYYAAAARPDAGGSSAYRAALRAVAGDSLLAGYDRARGAERSAWLRTFWSDLARRDLRDPAERLTEHYRRLAHAVQAFGLRVNRRYYAPNNIYRSDQEQYDDRGVVWIRHGPPDDRILVPLFGLPPLETWRYRRADGDLLLHFQAGGYSQAAGSRSLDFGGAIDDYRLVPTLFDWMYRQSSAYDMLLGSRCALHELYCKYMTWGPNGQAGLAAEERGLVTASAVIATGSDAMERRFARGLEARSELFAVGREGERSLVHVAFQIPVQVTEVARPGARLATAVHLRVAMLAPGGAVVGWVDTTTEASLPEGRPGLLDAFGRVTLTVPPGRWRYRVELSLQDSIGRVFPTDSLQVADFSGRRLALSDLVLGRPGIGAPWVPAVGDTAYFTPRATWARGDTLTLYHELYGLADREAYSARLSIRRGRKVELAIGWEGEATGPVTRVGRSISLARLAPGEYELALEVRGPDGSRSTARRRIRVTA